MPLEMIGLKIGVDSGPMVEGTTKGEDALETLIQAAARTEDGIDAISASLKKSGADFDAFAKKSEEAAAKETAANKAAEESAKRRADAAKLATELQIQASAELLLRMDSQITSAENLSRATDNLAARRVLEVHATDEQVRAMDTLLKRQAAVQGVTAVRGMEDELRLLGLTRNAREAELILREKGVEMAGEEIRGKVLALAVEIEEKKKSIALDEKAHAVIGRLEEEIELMKVSNEQRRETTRLQELGLTGATAEQKQKVLALQQELEFLQDVAAQKASTAKVEESLQREIDLLAMGNKEREVEIELASLGMGKADEETKSKITGYLQVIETLKEGNRLRSAASEALSGMREELDLLRLSKEERMVELKIRELGIEKASEEERAKVKALQSEIEAQKKLNEKLEDSEEQEKRFGESVEGAGASVLGQIASVAGLTIGLNSLVNFLQDATEQALAYQEAMADIEVQLPGNRERLDELSEGARRLAIEFGTDKQDVIRGMGIAVKAFGDNADEANGTIAKLAVGVKFSQAANISTADAMSLLSFATKAFGDDSVEAMEKTSDLAFVTAKYGNVDLPALASAMGRVSAGAGALGISQEELFATMGTLSQSMGGVERAGMALTAMNKSLVRPSKELDAVLLAMGHSSARAAIDARGYQGALEGIFNQVGKDQGKFQELFKSTEAMAAGVKIASEETETFTDLLEKNTKAAGESDVAFRARTEGVAAAGDKFNKVKAILDDFKTSVGEGLIPVLTDMVDAFIDIDQPAEDLRENIKGLAENAVLLAEAGATVGVAFAGQYVAGLAAAQSATVSFSAVAAIAAKSMVWVAGVTAALESLQAAREGMEAWEAQAKAEEDVGKAAEQDQRKMDKLRQELGKRGFTEEQAVKAGVIEKRGEGENEELVIRNDRLKELLGTMEEEKRIAEETAEAEMKLSHAQESAAVSTANAKGEIEKLRAALEKESLELESKIAATEAGDDAMKKSRITILNHWLETAKMGEISEETADKMRDLIGVVEEKEKKLKKATDAQKAKEKADEAEKKIVDGQIKSYGDLNQSLDEQIENEERKIANLESGKKADEESVAMKVKQKIASEDLNLVDSESIAILEEKAQKVDKLRGETENLTEAEKSRKEDFGLIATMEKENAAMRLRITLGSEYTKVAELSGDADQRTIDKLKGLIDEQSKLNDLGIVAKLKEENDKLEMVAAATDKVAARKQLHAKASEEVVSRLDKELDRNSKLLAQDIIKKLEKELEFQKLSNDERERELKLREMGLELATEEQKARALELKQQIDLVKARQNKKTGMEEESESAFEKSAAEMMKAFEKQGQHVTADNGKIDFWVEKGVSQETIMKMVEELRKKIADEERAVADENMRRIEEEEEAKRKIEDEKKRRADEEIAALEKKRQLQEEIAKKQEEMGAAEKEAADQRLDAVEKEIAARREQADIEEEIQETIEEFNKKRLEQEKELSEQISELTYQRADKERELRDLQLSISEEIAGNLVDTMDKITGAMDRAKSAGEGIDDALESIGAGKSTTSKVTILKNEEIILRTKLADETDLEERGKLVEEIQQKIVDRYRLEKESVDEAMEHQRNAAKERLDGLKKERDEQERNIEVWRGLSDNLRGRIEGLQLGGLSPLAPEQKVEVARARFETVAAASAGGDIEATKKLGEAADTLLAQGREAFRSDERFQEIFSLVTDTLTKAQERAGIEAEGGAVNLQQIDSEIEYRQKDIETSIEGNALQQETIRQLQGLADVASLIQEDAKVAFIGEIQNLATVFQGNGDLTIEQLGSLDTRIVEGLRGVLAEMGIKIKEEDKVAELQARAQTTREEIAAVNLQMKNLMEQLAGLSASIGNEQRTALAALNEKNDALKAEVAAIADTLRRSAAQMAVNWGR